MRLIRNVCKECKDNNFLEREFNYELGLCNNCLKKSLMPKYEYKGYFSYQNIPTLPGKLIDVTNDCKYIVTSTGLYDISGLNKLYGFEEKISAGAFSDDSGYFIGFTQKNGFCLKKEEDTWVKIKDIIIQSYVIETIFSDGEFLLIIKDQTNLYFVSEKNKLAKLNIDDFRIKFLSNVDSNLLKSFFKKPHKYNDFMKQFYEIPADLLDSYGFDENDLYPLDESHLVITKNKKFFVDLNRGKSVKIPYYSWIANKYLYANKLNLLIYSDYVIDRSGFDRCLIVFSTKNNEIVLQLYFDYPIRGHYISKDNSLLVVVTKDISYVINTHNWNILAILEHNDQVEGCVILDNKTIITETDNGYLYLWSNIL